VKIPFNVPMVTCFVAIGDAFQMGKISSSTGVVSTGRVLGFCARTSQEKIIINQNTIGGIKNRNGNFLRTSGGLVIIIIS
jgi:hypothetical protein